MWYNFEVLTLGKATSVTDWCWKWRRKIDLCREDGHLSSDPLSLNCPWVMVKMCRGKIVLQAEIWIKHRYLEWILHKWEWKSWDRKKSHKELHGVRRKGKAESCKSINEEETGREKCLWMRLTKNCESRKKTRKMLCHKIRATNQGQKEQRSQIRWGPKCCPLELATRPSVILETIFSSEWWGWKPEFNRVKTR